MYQAVVCWYSTGLEGGVFGGTYFQSLPECLAWIEKQMDRRLEMGKECEIRIYSNPKVYTNNTMPLPT